MKNLIISFIAGLLVGAIGMFFLKKCDEKPIDVPIDIKIPVPGKDTIFVPIKEPKPLPDTLKIKNPINIKLKKELDSARSLIDSLEAYKAFAVKREYKEIFEDSTQKITVNAETTGTLDLVNVGYEIFPDTINYKDTLKIKVPSHNKFYFGGEIVVPSNNSNMSHSFAPKLGMLNKKQNKLYTLDVDFINKSVEGGILFEF